jgi:hypothetical protein
MMHAAAHANEFDLRYTKTPFTKQIKAENAGSRLSADDRNASLEVQRVIVCHVKGKTERKKDKRPCKQFRKQRLGHEVKGSKTQNQSGTSD